MTRVCYDEEQAWLVAALQAAALVASGAHDLKEMRWQAFEVSRAFAAIRHREKINGSDILALYEDVLSSAGGALGLGRKAGVGETRKALITRGRRDLASILSNLSKGRRVPAHPTSDLVEQVKAALQSTSGYPGDDSAPLKQSHIDCGQSDRVDPAD